MNSGDAEQQTKRVDGDGPFVLHTCDNPPCCNPAHLYRGTALDNARDRDTRGRWKNHWRKTA